jgi:hypothetical protein
LATLFGLVGVAGVADDHKAAKEDHEENNEPSGDIYIGDDVVKEVTHGVIFVLGVVILKD